MKEYEVTLTNGTAWVYADTYVRLGGLYQFYVGDTVAHEFDDHLVVSVKECK